VKAFFVKGTLGWGAGCGGVACELGATSVGAAPMLLLIGVFHSATYIGLAAIPAAQLGWSSALHGLRCYVQCPHETELMHFLQYLINCHPDERSSIVGLI
jgi:hypothetical protein